MIFPKKTDQKYRTALPGGRATTLGDGTAISGGGTPETGYSTVNAVPASSG